VLNFFASSLACAQIWLSLPSKSANLCVVCFEVQPPTLRGLGERSQSDGCLRTAPRVGDMFVLPCGPRSTHLSPLFMSIFSSLECPVWTQTGCCARGFMRSPHPYRKVSSHTGLRIDRERFCSGSKVAGPGGAFSLVLFLPCCSEAESLFLFPTGLSRGEREVFCFFIKLFDT